MQKELRVALCQCDVVWEDAVENCRRLEGIIGQGLDGGECDLVVLPEFFSMGFTVDPEAVAAEGGYTLEWLRKVSRRYDIALVGSIPTAIEGGIANRCCFISPLGDECFYDKRHLFRMGEENLHYVAGGERVTVAYKGWNISLNVCYDLRFPVWSRNVDNGYDLLINIASWPASRIGVTEHLIKSRAIENMSYALFCNRIGEDPQNSYCGGSRVVSPRGEDIALMEDLGSAQWLRATLSAEKLTTLREKFPAWMDADKFEISKNR